MQIRGPNAVGTNPLSARDGRVANFETDTKDDTLVGSAIDAEKNEADSQENMSTWQGKPNGTTYDRRLELTEEDEDTWARLAM